MISATGSIQSHCSCRRRLLLATTKVVELRDVSCARPVVVGQYAPVGVFSFPNVKLSLSVLLCHCMTRRYNFPFHFSTRMEFNSNSMPLIRQTASPSRQAWSRRRKSTCWHGYKNGCNEPPPFPQSLPSTSRNPCGHEQHALPMPPAA